MWHFREWNFIYEKKKWWTRCDIFSWMKFHVWKMMDQMWHFREWSFLYKNSLFCLFFCEWIYVYENVTYGPSHQGERSLFTGGGAGRCKYENHAHSKFVTPLDNTHYVPPSGFAQVVVLVRAKQSLLYNLWSLCTVSPEIPKYFKKAQCLSCCIILFCGKIIACHMNDEEG